MKPPFTIETPTLEIFMSVTQSLFSKFGAKELRPDNYTSYTDETCIHVFFERDKYVQNFGRRSFYYSNRRFNTFPIISYEQYLSRINNYTIGF
jgi:hypothetical protein